MWLFTGGTDAAFLSIVADKADPAMLRVRARLPGDIERVFLGAEVVEDGGTDYRFRAILPRDTVADAVRQVVAGITYGNFKDSIEDDDRHDTYLRVWQVMFDAQERARPKPVRWRTRRAKP